MTLKLNGTNSVAAPAYAGDDADTGLQCGTNELKLVTAGTARATVDSSGNLGVGTTTPSQSWTGGSSKTQQLSGLSGQITVLRVNEAGGGGGDLQLVSSSNAEAAVYNFANGPLRFGTNGAEKMRILSDGTIRLSSNSPGIDFSQIQTNASGMTSETLDSYEEGTWTPTTAGDSTGAISSASGFYTKVGNLVVCSFSFTLTTNFTNGEVGGLPFTPKDIGPNFNGAFVQTTADRAFVVQNHNSRLVTLKISNGTYPAVTNSTRCTITYLTA